MTEYRNWYGEIVPKFSYIYSDQRSWSCSAANLRELASRGIYPQVPLGMTVEEWFADNEMLVRRGVLKALKEAQ